MTDGHRTPDTEHQTVSYMRACATHCPKMTYKYETHYRGKRSDSYDGVGDQYHIARTGTLAGRDAQLTDMRALPSAIFSSFFIVYKAIS